MVSKRKKSTIATARDVEIKRQPPSPVLEDPLAKPDQQRSIGDVKEMTEPGVCLRRRPPPRAASFATKRREQDNEVHEPRESVRTTMKELSDTESRPQNAVKRQRSAVQNSDIVINSKPSKHSPLNTRSLRRRSQKDFINQKLDQKPPAPAPPEDLETAPMAYCKAEDAVNDISLDKTDLDNETDDEVVERGAARAPAVNSEYIPLPWKGRLGYACLNTYLRSANPPVFSSRTCRIASILLHQHPLLNPSEPEHPTKNRPDESKPKDVKLGQKYVRELGLANARDIVKMLRWNDKYGIRFMRLSSGMFPFASHEEYGYSLFPFASETLAEAGAVAAELGHRLTTHPGQFTQLGSPRKEVVTAAIRDLEYHDELLSLLKLPEQQDRDAVMVLHMGGTFGDKAATLDRFRQNYSKLSPSVKRRLVLENDDVSWSVHDLLPICEELNIPLVLDFHHHNIIFDSTQLREGTQDIMELYPRIKATWTRKGIRQKMHYSEPCAGAVTPRDRRKHSPRVRTLPPCPDDMDLMIEAKDKEQAVFELMRAFTLPGYGKFNDMVPHERTDERRSQRGGANTNKAKKQQQKATPKKGKKRKSDGDGDGDYMYVENGVEDEGEALATDVISAEDFGMGGTQGRVYWYEGMEAWLRPKKREVKRNTSRGVVDDGG